MIEEKMHVINKIFNNETVRIVWDNETEKYYVSIIDIIRILTTSYNPRKYWSVLKTRLKREGSELTTICSQLKLKASDGKYYNTDVTDIEGMFRIIESIPSKNAEPIKRWLARLGKERIDEVFDPSISIQRAINLYRSKGYNEEWIKKRIRTLQDRKQLTDVWKEHGVYENFEISSNTRQLKFKAMD